MEHLTLVEKKSASLWIQKPCGEKSNKDDTNFVWNHVNSAMIFQSLITYFSWITSYVLDAKIFKIKTSTATQEIKTFAKESNCQPEVNEVNQIKFTRILDVEMMTKRKKEDLLLNLVLKSANMHWKIHFFNFIFFEKLFLFKDLQASSE